MFSNLNPLNGFEAKDYFTFTSFTMYRLMRVWRNSLNFNRQSSKNTFK